jgi:hypothetical protein
MDFFPLSPSVAVAGYFTQHVITCSRVESLILGAVRTLRQYTSTLVSANGFQEEIKDRLPSDCIVHGSTTIMTALRHSSSGSGSHVHGGGNNDLANSSKCFLQAEKSRPPDLLKPE